MTMPRIRRIAVALTLTLGTTAMAFAPPSRRVAFGQGTAIFAAKSRGSNSQQHNNNHNNNYPHANPPSQNRPSTARYSNATTVDHPASAVGATSLFDDNYDAVVVETDWTTLQLDDLEHQQAQLVGLEVEPEPHRAPPVLLEDTVATTATSIMTTSSRSVVIPDDANTTDNAKAVTTARLLLLCAAALYGTNFSAVKLLGDTDLSVGVSSTLRFGLAALATAPWLIPSNNKEDMTSETESTGAVPSQTTNYFESSEWLATVAGFEVGMWNSVGYVAQAVGLETTLASKSAFLCSLAVVTVPLLDWITGGQKLQTKQTLGIAMAVFGVACLELGGTNVSDLLPLSSGDTASLLQPLAFGMGFWRMERAMHDHPDEAVRSTAAQLLAVFLGSAIYTVATAESPATLAASLPQVWETVSHNPWIAAALVWTGCVTTAATVYMETIALKTLSAAETTLILSTEPVWGSVVAAGALGETFGGTAMAGGAMILAGCLVSNLGVEGLRDMVVDKVTAVVRPSENSNDIDLPKM